jgi:hypothetical protein
MNTGPSPSWQLSGQSLELCNCKMMCPCWLGPEGEIDQDFCGGVFAFDIQNGSSEGIDLGGTRVALAFEWPGNFFHGNGTARLYIGDSAKAEQIQQLDAIFTGKKGGPLEPVWGAVVSTWLPTQTTGITMEWGDSPTVRVGDFAEVNLTRLKGQTGESIKVQGAPAQLAFQLASMDLASSKGSRWADPERRAWSGDSGTLHQFSWSA